MTITAMPDPQGCYAAVQLRDPRFDGVFFTAVRTTRIYCRCICPARTPLFRNATFYAAAAAAQEAGYRPCLRCRPESAPESPAWVGSLASVNRALRRIDEGVLAEAGVEALAEGLGMTGRHLRRLFVQHLGTTPVAVEQARRINLAKQLLHETRLSMTEIAFASGFGSLRRFNQAFLALFGRPPTALRRELGVEPRAGEVLRLRLAYRPPFSWRERVGAWEGEGSVDGACLRVPLEEGGEAVVAQGAGRTLDLTLQGVPVRDLARVIARLRRELLHGAPLELARAA